MLIDIRSNKDYELIQIGKSGHPKPTVGLTSGCFDLFHSLHLAYLQKCRRMCDVLIVGVDGDDFVRKVKGSGRPIVPEHQRVMLVNALDCVDIAFVMGSLEDWNRAIHAFFPDKLFKNTNFNPKDVINPLNAEVIIVPDVVTADSTTAIIQEILKTHER
jgi:D-beta-D-heptose 7-phosphate kinase / D-beta-D-heptose 1-phosphate adenosyltransferase